MKIIKISLVVMGLFFSYVVFKSMYTPFIKMELINRNYQPLEDNDNLGWKIKFQNWQEQSKNVNKVDYSSQEDLRRRCKSIMFNTFTGVDSSDFIEARDWCTKPKSFKNKAKDDKYILIDKNDYSNWDKKVEAYKNSIINMNPISMMKENDKVLLKSDITVNKLYIWCSNKSSKYWTKSDGEYSTYLTHCALSAS